MSIPIRFGNPEWIFLIRNIEISNTNKKRHAKNLGIIKITSKKTRF